MRIGQSVLPAAGRWDPKNLGAFICRDKIEFVEKDAFDIINKYKKHRNAIFFIDPPYTAGGKQAGNRLYRSCISSWICSWKSPHEEYTSCRYL